MGNFKFLYNFLDYTPTPSTENAPLYAAVKVKDYAHLRRAWHTTVITASSILLDFGSSKPVLPIFLDDVNYVNIQVAWNNTDSWGAPTIAFQSHVIPYDYEVSRYKKPISPPAGAWPNLRYAKINILAQTPTDGAAFFRTGRIIVPQTTLELTANPSPGNYKKDTKEPDPIENKLYNGTAEKVSIGTYQQFLCSMGFNVIEEFDEVALKALNAIPRTQQMILWENQSDDSQAWLVSRKNTMSRTQDIGQTRKVAEITFEEIIG